MRGLDGAALSVDEVIAYALCGHGERRRPASGWASLTPPERDVVLLVSEGLANKDRTSPRGYSFLHRPWNPT